MPLYKRLYKQDSKGKTRVWEIYHDHDMLCYWTHSGLKDGQVVQSGHVYVHPKVNRTQTEQCELEMDAKIEKKRRERYVEDVSKVAGAGDVLPGYTPMLAKEYHKEKRKITYPVALQPKLDGVRCLMTKDGMFTRGRKPIESCQHIRKELLRLFDQDPNLVIDGELYAHELANDFEKIISAVRKSAKKATDEDLKRQEQVSYYVYDAPIIGYMTPEDPFDQRFLKLREMVSGFHGVIPVDTWMDIENETQIFEHHASFVQDGYEGTMVRIQNMPYVGKRSSNLMKLKDFEDSEFEIFAVVEGKGNLFGHAGSMELLLEEGNEQGAKFNAKMEGSFDRLRWIWQNPEEVIGKMATVRYQNLTSAGVPRFPVIKAIRGLKDRSDWL